MFSFLFFFLIQYDAVSVQDNRSFTRNKMSLRKTDRTKQRLAGVQETQGM